MYFRMFQRDVCIDLYKGDEENPMTIWVVSEFLQWPSDLVGSNISFAVIVWGCCSGGGNQVGVNGNWR